MIWWLEIMTNASIAGIRVQYLATKLQLTSQEAFVKQPIPAVCLLLENGEIQCVEAKDRPMIRLVLPNPATPAPLSQVRRRSLGATLRSGNATTKYHLDHHHVSQIH
jgi:hypothetical protein